MTKAEAVNWIINISADIGKIEHQDLWHYEQALDEIREMLEAKPERKAGKWHKRFYFRNSTKSYDCEMHVCSECGNEWSYDAETGVSDYNYCPNCGAKMEGIE